MQSFCETLLAVFDRQGRAHHACASCPTTTTRSSKPPTSSACCRTARECTDACRSCGTARKTPRRQVWCGAAERFMRNDAQFLGDDELRPSQPGVSRLRGAHWQDWAFPSARISGADGPGVCRADLARVSDSGLRERLGRRGFMNARSACPSVSGRSVSTFRVLGSQHTLKRGHPTPCMVSSLQAERPHSHAKAWTPNNGWVFPLQGVLFGVYPSGCSAWFPLQGAGLPGPWITCETVPLKNTSDSLSPFRKFAVCVW